MNHRNPKGEPDLLTNHDKCAPVIRIGVFGFQLFLGFEEGDSLELPESLELSGSCNQAIKIRVKPLAKTSDFKIHVPDQQPLSGKIRSR